MERTKVDSKLLESIGYDSGSETLQVQFKGKDGKRGNIYNYYNVGAVCAKEFLAAKSIGQFFLAKVKPVYKCERATHDEKEEAAQAAASQED